MISAHPSSQLEGLVFLCNPQCTQQDRYQTSLKFTRRRRRLADEEEEDGGRICIWYSTTTKRITWLVHPLFINIPTLLRGLSLSYATIITRRVIITKWSLCRKNFLCWPLTDDGLLWSDGQTDRPREQVTRQAVGCWKWSNLEEQMKTRSLSLVNVLQSNERKSGAKQRAFTWRVEPAMPHRERQKRARNRI